MKFLDFRDLLDGAPAQLAVLSTYQFDPDYFERQLLPRPALAQARRILIFMDRGQWLSLLHQDYPARLLNRRYLVVPVVCKPPGVFHPKLSLLVSDESIKVLCGSNNLTRSGCASNLELLNTLDVHPAKPDAGTSSIAAHALAFFRRACKDSTDGAAGVANEWLDEIEATYPVLTKAVHRNGSGLQLAHTYTGPLWEILKRCLAQEPPTKFLVISPFFDTNCGLVRRLAKDWPKAEIELVVQQNTTTLDTTSLTSIQRRISLSELRTKSRRLHAKLLAWETRTSSGCIVGSANFTTAAYGALNVEACLVLPDMAKSISGLFDSTLSKRPISFDDFEPGGDEEPAASESDTPELQIIDAVLTADHNLRLSYSHRLDPKPTVLRVALRGPGEVHPRVAPNLPLLTKGTATVPVPATVLSDSHGVLRASLVAEIGELRLESLPTWVIQQAQLTHEASGSSGPKDQRQRIEDSGSGLLEFLKELGDREGIAAVIEFLKKTNIRFHDGAGHGPPGRRFKIEIRDPFRPDDRPEWLIRSATDHASLLDAIYDFADRHERGRLRRHAERGNINGADNFLDIFAAIVRLLYVYYVQGLIPRSQLMGRYTAYLRIATIGIDEESDYCPGYLQSVDENLSQDRTHLITVTTDLNFLGYLWATLLIAQKIRSTADQGKERRPEPRTYLANLETDMTKAIQALGLDYPSFAQVEAALKAFNMLSPSELDELLDQYRSS